MTDLKPDHPAVRAANMGVQEWLAGDGPFDDDPVRLAHDMTAACITAALPHLTADDLRDTPAVADLIAERDTYREFAFEVDGLQRALEDGELDLRHCDTRLVPTEEVMDWLGQLIKRVRSGLIHQEGDA